MEERNKNIDPQNKLEALFKKVYKKHQVIYGDYIKYIKPLTSLNDDVKKKIEKLGIDGQMIEDNIEKWLKL